MVGILDGVNWQNGFGQGVGGILNNLGTNMQSPLVMSGLALASGRSPQEGFQNMANAMMMQAMFKRQNEKEAKADERDKRDFAFREADAKRQAAQWQQGHDFQRQQADKPQIIGNERTGYFGVRPSQMAGENPALGKPLIPGTPAAPQTTTIKDGSGNERTVTFDPTSKTWKPVDVEGGNPTPSNPYASGKFNNEQGKAAGFADRMIGAEGALRAGEQVNSGTGVIMGSIPPDYVPNMIKSADRQKMEQAQRDFVNAILRRESGAAISPSEFENARRQYFPMVGDAPEVIGQKRRNRQTAIEAIMREGGQGYAPKVVFDQQGNMVPNPAAQPRGSDMPNPGGDLAAQGGLPKISSPEQAAQLPKGTRFLDPNGVVRVVP